LLRICATCDRVAVEQPKLGRMLVCQAAKLERLFAAQSLTKRAHLLLGRFSALRYEIMDRTSFKGRDDSSGKIVAEIGPEKWTEADLTSLIEQTIDSQLAPMRPFMTPDQLNSQKKKMLEQFKSPQSKQQLLSSYLAQEILYRQALEEKLLDTHAVKQQLNEVTRSLLAQALMNQQLASKIHITDSDLQTYYHANQTDYQEPEKAHIRHILVDSPERAAALIKTIKGGEDFSELAQAVSMDTQTKDKGGLIETDVTPGAYVPLIGSQQTLNDAIFAASPGTVLDQPFQTDKGWEVVKVDSRQPARQKSFDEVRQEVMQTLSTQKREEIQQDYIQQMMDKYNVVIHTSTFQPDNAATEDGEQ